jgi:hypothetical protein
MTCLILIGMIGLIVGFRIVMRIIKFAIEAIALYVAFVIVALATALLCVGSGHHGEFVRAAIAGLTGGP